MELRQLRYFVRVIELGSMGRAAVELGVVTSTPYRIEWQPKAREDLRAIVRYIGKDNPAKAPSFDRELRDKTLPLAQHPELGRAGRPGAPDYVRELVAHGNYIVFYRALHEARTVEILRVKHALQQTL